MENSLFTFENGKPVEGKHSPYMDWTYNRAGNLAHTTGYASADSRVLEESELTYDDTARQVIMVMATHRK